MAAHLAAAAEAILPLVMGPRVDGVILGSFARAVVIGIEGPHGPRVLSLLSHRAAGVPNGVRLAGAVRFTSCRPGDPVEIGTGQLTAGELTIRVVRSWPSRVHPIRQRPTGVEVLTAAAGRAGRGVPLAAIRRLQEALDDPPQQDLNGALDGLIGLGKGLTPGGDDVVAGLIIGLHARRHTAVARRIGDRAVQLAPDRTTLLSADLLRLADQGHACLEALTLLRAINRSEQSTRADAAAPVSRAVHRLLSIGHTSGADLATGLTMGLRFGAGLEVG